MRELSIVIGFSLLEGFVERQPLSFPPPLIFPKNLSPLFFLFPVDGMESLSIEEAHFFRHFLHFPAKKKALQRVSASRSSALPRPLCSARESIYITRAGSIYRSYSVFHGRIPFVSPVHALIIPRTSLSCHPLPVRGPHANARRGETRAGGRADSIIAALHRDNNRRVVAACNRSAEDMTERARESDREKQCEPHKPP